MGRRNTGPPQFNLADHLQMFEVFLSHTGVDPAGARIDGDGFVGWAVTRGSAANYVFVEPGPTIPECEASFVSPVVRLPGENLLPFYRRCLEINAVARVGSLAVLHNVVFAVHRRSLAGLDPLGIATCFDAVSGLADAADDVLCEVFGAALACDVDEEWIIAALDAGA